MDPDFSVEVTATIESGDQPRLDNLVAEAAEIRARCAHVAEEAVTLRFFDVWDRSLPPRPAFSLAAELEQQPWFDAWANEVAARENVAASEK